LAETHVRGSDPELPGQQDVERALRLKDGSSVFLSSALIIEVDNILLLDFEG
jgi:hypothetical protein